MTRDYSLGIDVGGTFTDVVLIGQDSTEVHHTKSPSTPSNPERGALTGIEKILDETGTAPDQIRTVIHGTTVATNAIIERTGADTGLIVTEGFRDVLEIRRQDRPHLYDFRQQKDPAVIPRQKIEEIDERVLPTGEIRDDLNEDSVREAITTLKNSGVEAVAICLLHAYANDSHEKRISEIIEEEAPELKISISSEILPEIKEYERMSTVSMNAYLLPVMDKYLNNFQEGLRETEVTADLNIMQSNGGIMTANTARRNTVQTALSGPAAGALGGGTLTETNSFITADMGGTSFDIALSHNEGLVYSDETEISGHILRVPMVDINTIGAGGGSIAWIDKGGALRVGPRSAGADPGPVAYGKGGSEPTVTDAHVVLGRLNQEYLLGGEMAVELQGAKRAVEEKIADPLDLSLEEAAQGILDVVNANMVQGIRVVSVERGYDPREFSLITFGGAGPLHSAQLIDEMDMEEAIIPYTPGVNSAVGLLTADYQQNHLETYLTKLTSADPDEILNIVEQLREQALADLLDEGIDESDVSMHPQLQARYYGQGYDLDIGINTDELERDLRSSIAESFHQRHEREYGFRRTEEDIEIVNITLTAVGETYSPKFKIDNSTVADEEPEITTTRDVYFDGEWRTAPIYSRDDLRIGHQLSGPLIVEQQDSTTVVPDGHSVSIDEYRNIVIRSSES